VSLFFSTSRMSARWVTPPNGLDAGRRSTQCAADCARNTAAAPALAILFDALGSTMVCAACSTVKFMKLLSNQLSLNRLRDVEITKFGGGHVRTPGQSLVAVRASARSDRARATSVHGCWAHQRNRWQQTVELMSRTQL
jgi:hypothetical protein